MIIFIQQQSHYIFNVHEDDYVIFQVSHRNNNCWC